MVPLTSLLLPVLVSAVIVFVASSIMNAVLTYHFNDVTKLPDEDGVRAALGRFTIPPGDYMIPRAASMQAIMTVVRPGPFHMGRSLVQWFIYCAIIAFFAAYVASRTLPAAAPYLSVFRIVGTVAFIGFAGGLWQDSIWWNRKWSTTIKHTIDCLIYALLTAGTFGWLWPG